MIFRNSPREYPHFAAYLVVARGRSLGRINSEMVSAVILTILGFFLFPLLIEFKTPALVYLLILAVTWIMAIRARPRPPTAAEMLQRDATVLATRMSRRLERSRLHRDLGDPTLTVLEECARCWSDIQHTLHSNFWRATDLPAHYAGLRDQILAAADQAMDETILLFQAIVPERDRGLSPIGAVIEEAVFGAKSGPLPPGFEKARETADKLRHLSSEVAAVNRQASQELDATYDKGAGRAIDLCIGELKEMRQAQDELRQNLGGQG